MKQKLFENVGGNQFKLLTENINGMPKSVLVKEGLRKVFMNAGNVITYKHLQGVGLGYIKDVSEAKKCAIQEARILAKEYGYTDNENSQTFVKEIDLVPPHYKDAVVDTSEESREVQIGKEIIRRTSHLVNKIPEDDWARYVTPIQELAKELIQMHGQA